ncbi:MAG: DNA translocase FtsK, partial [Armatimonadetes bacterium]|nr:DNA translocase FtsK [Armatimonadota bacterium]
ATPAEVAAEPVAESPATWHPQERIAREPVPLEVDGHPRQMVLPGMPQPPALSEMEAAWYADGEPTGYRMPPLGLVEPPKAPPLPDRSPEIIANSRRLEETLGSFKIEAHVVNTEVGPTVTRYEMDLAPGIRVSKVANLADDIAMALASTGIRIEAPVPGKGVIGIEVPNQIRETVHLHSVLLSKEFGGAPGPLPFVIGKDIAGHIKIGELTRMPHVLVAGSTNSGKSVCLNCIIISLIYRLSPRDLRFLMIDPKRVELTLYDGIPHLDRPVVTDPEDAADLLRGAVREMMARYDRLHDLGVRNIASYNAQVDEAERMPYIVIIIDELAELMMLARAEVEASICRLAQLARATGIHLVVATQRPSVNVVTGSIKANIGTRIAFAVAQQVDSRVILDQVGAERLIGRGDMLYSPIDNTKPERIQGAFVDEKQVHQLVEYLQAMPSTLRVQYAESIIQPVAADSEESEDEGYDDTELDELFWECVEFVRREGEASTSRLQRTYGIGYNRAGRITDQMHKLGIVGPARGSKPREVLPGGPMGPNDLRRREPDLFDELTRGVSADD